MILLLIVANLMITESQCQATNEEEVFKILNERSLCPVGWIHVCLPILSLMLIKSRGVCWLVWVEHMKFHKSILQ